MGNDGHLKDAIIKICGTLNKVNCKKMTWEWWWGDGEEEAEVGGGGGGGGGKQGNFSDEKDNFELFFSIFQESITIIMIESPSHDYVIHIINITIVSCISQLLYLHVYHTCDVKGKAQLLMRPIKGMRSGYNNYYILKINTKRD